MRAAILWLTSTLEAPAAIVSTAGTQTRVSPTRAAGMNPMTTSGLPAETGPPTCGTGPGFTMGHVCMSEIRAAGGMLSALDLIRRVLRQGFLRFLGLGGLRPGSRPGRAS